MNITETRQYNLEQYNKLRTDFHFQDHQARSADFEDTKRVFLKYWGNDPASKNQGNPESGLISFGRITQIRRIGKIAFFKVRLGIGEIQLVFKKDLTKDWEASLFLDYQDVIDFSGWLGLTSTGEVSVFVEHFAIKRKCLESPPAKWEGVTDKDVIYNSRHVDLLSNIDSAKVFHKRAKLIKEFRNYFDSKGLLEVETNSLQKYASGATAKPFTTYHEVSDNNLNLRISPELNLKKLMVGNISSVGVYEIGKSYRNEGVSSRHNPEFCMLEKYEYSNFPSVEETYLSLIEEIIDVLKSLVKISKDIVIWSFKDDWSKTIQELGIDQKCDIVEVFDSIIENHLIDKYSDKILIVKDHPMKASPLAKELNNSEFAARLEVYINGIEIMNAYVEQDSPERQENAFKSQGYIDENFIQALNYGLPLCTGIGIGIDRLIQVICDLSSIKDVILFPY